jgi:predicted DNA-binding transcriptional regulator YafY
MSKREYLLRYLAIIKTMRNKKTATFADIADYLKTESELSGYSLSVSPRTFQRDLDEIASLFNIEIKYDFSRRCYFIEQEESRSEINNRMLEAFDLFNALNVATSIEPYVLFEKRKVLGTSHFPGLLHAIQNRLVTNISYCKFYEEESELKTIYPYALKESQNRWYLVATDTRDKKMKTYGLDRILQLEFPGYRFDRNDSMETAGLFRHCFGIISEDQPPSNIVLEFDLEQGRYIKAFPLHESQQVKELKDCITIELEMYITHDFIMEILKYGPRVKVIKPARLRNVIVENLKKNIALYS